MAKALAKVKVGDLLKSEKMNEIIERINNLEKRLAKLEGKTLKRKTLKVKTPKKKTLKRKSPKTGPLSHIDSVK
jgi:preprotein translocase subunit SecA